MERALTGPMSMVAKLIATKELEHSASVWDTQPSERKTLGRWECSPRQVAQRQPAGSAELILAARVAEGEGAAVEGLGAQAQRGDAVALCGGVAVAAEGKGYAAALRGVVHLLVLVLLTAAGSAYDSTY